MVVPSQLRCPTAPIAIIAVALRSSLELQIAPVGIVGVSELGKPILRIDHYGM